MYREGESINPVETHSESGGQNLAIAAIQELERFDKCSPATHDSLPKVVLVPEDQSGRGASPTARNGIPLRTEEPSSAGAPRMGADCSPAKSGHISDRSSSDDHSSNKLSAPTVRSASSSEGQELPPAQQNGIVDILGRPNLGGELDRLREQLGDGDMDRFTKRLMKLQVQQSEIEAKRLNELLEKFGHKNGPEDIVKPLREKLEKFGQPKEQGEFKPHSKPGPAGSPLRMEVQEREFPRLEGFRTEVSNNPQPPTQKPGIFDQLKKSSDDFLDQTKKLKDKVLDETKKTTDEVQAAPGVFTDFLKELKRSRELDEERKRRSPNR